MMNSRRPAMRIPSRSSLMVSAPRLRRQSGRWCVELGIVRRRNPWCREIFGVGSQLGRSAPIWQSDPRAVISTCWSAGLSNPIRWEGPVTDRIAYSPWGGRDIQGGRGHPYFAAQETWWSLHSRKRGWPLSYLSPVLGHLPNTDGIDQRRLTERYSMSPLGLPQIDNLGNSA